MPGALPDVVKAVLGELHGEAMVRRLVQAGNKTFYQLLGQKFKATGMFDFVNWILQGAIKTVNLTRFAAFTVPILALPVWYSLPNYYLGQP